MERVRSVVGTVVGTVVVVAGAVVQSLVLVLKLALVVQDWDNCTVRELRFYRAGRSVGRGVVAERTVAAVAAVVGLVGDIVVAVAVGRQVVVEVEAPGVGIVAAGPVPGAGVEVGHIGNWGMGMEIVWFDNPMPEGGPAAAQAVPGKGYSAVALSAEEPCRRDLVIGIAAAVRAAEEPHQRGHVVGIVTAVLAVVEVAAVQGVSQRDSRLPEARLAFAVLERVVRCLGYKMDCSRGMEALGTEVETGWFQLTELKEMQVGKKDCS